MAKQVILHTDEFGEGWTKQNENNTEIYSAVALNTDKATYPSGDATKVGYISITQAVDLDIIEARVNSLDAAVVLRGEWDASVGTFPGSGTAQAGDSWIVSVGGTVDSKVFSVNDRVIAILDSASASVFAANWIKADYTDQVLSVAGRTGAVVITAGDISDFDTEVANNPAVAANTSKVSADTANVTAAGALMDSEVDADIKTLTLPASTTISTFGKSLVDDTTAALARATLEAAASGVNPDITSLTALDDGGIPLSAIGMYYGVAWDESTDTYTRTGSLAGQPVSQTLSDALLPIQASQRRCIMNDAGEVQYYLGAADSTKREDGVLAADLTGADGQVVVQRAKFYYRYSFSGTTHTYDISLFPLPGFSVHPMFLKNGEVVDYRYPGAYEGVGYDDSVAAYIDSGCVAATNWSGTVIDLVNDKIGSVSGFCPMVDETRPEFRAICANRGAGWRQQEFDFISGIQLLYLVEYADWNSQAMIGPGRTNLSGGTWTKDSYIGTTGLSNGDGNGTNSVHLGGTAGYLTDYMTYRGIENFFGNVWKWVDGINIQDNVHCVCNTDTDFADDTAVGYTALGITLPAVNGYQKTLQQQPRGFLPASVGGASNTYITDYYYQSTGFWRVVALGGGSTYGALAGVASWLANYASSYDNVHIGCRICR
ncbi:MAG: hypothetical protein PF503_06185 [Desulfobacula sp.]|jgi:hypothetical protein|nr:hypothetical protein [Desulfobacula sp.]